MLNESVVLKGKKDGVSVILSPDMPFSIIMSDVIEKFNQSKSFFSSGAYNINFSGRSLSQDERLQLEKNVSEILSECEISIGYQELESSPKKIFKDIKEGYTKFHEGTIRSGQLLESEGNLVVIGDVNPGSEIVAAGNIVVMGAVRGIVHAGCTGNRDAFIVALNLSPTQIRIADIITRPPDNDVRHEIIPERAYIKDNTIYIDEFLYPIK
ncbi:MAG: septum site-determining protein MinC [Clostridia bacterium]|nr:septum site-determining protein MinC [Clostridia bacterium]